VLNPVSRPRHVLVGITVLIIPVLVLLGVMGTGNHAERFDAKQVWVTPTVDGNGVTIREVVDQDFGTNQRHGYERYIPNDFGTPTDVTATSPDASAELEVLDVGDHTRIRIGDPGTTIDGQHRYVLTYTLPDARLSSGSLALDIIGSGETLTTDRFEVVLTGFDLTAPTCNVGLYGTAGGCTLTRDDSSGAPVYRVLFAPLEPNYGITVGGTIASLGTPTEIPEPAMITHRKSNPGLLALAAIALGAVGAAGMFTVARRKGRNEVGGTDAADAAYAAPPVVPGSSTPPPTPMPTRLVTDKQLEAMATTEFVPPTGLRPWQGRMLLRESIDRDTVSAWFSDQIALEYLALTDGKPQVLSAGSKFAQAPPITRARLVTLLGSESSTLELGTYEPRLATLWEEIMDEQRAAAESSGWWSKFPPGRSASFPWPIAVGTVLMVIALVISVWVGFGRTWSVALLAALAIPTLVASASYRQLLPVRSAAGSAMALRTESFRRFLKASEGTHVDWAWQHGLLREYSAWAVALGAADAWGRAVANSAVPPAEVRMNTTPLLIATYASSWSATHTAPSSSSGGGGGGFSGGFSGGGGGGGSSGSW
jgi:uncharacterized membrane protein YgcG